MRKVAIPLAILALIGLDQWVTLGCGKYCP